MDPHDDIMEIICRQILVRVLLRYGSSIIAIILLSIRLPVYLSGVVMAQKKRRFRFRKKKKRERERRRRRREESCCGGCFLCGCGWVCVCIVLVYIIILYVSLIFQQGQRAAGSAIIYMASPNLHIVVVVVLVVAKYYYIYHNNVGLIYTSILQIFCSNNNKIII